LTDLKLAISDVRKRIAEAAAKSGRAERDVKLVAVTKTVSPQVINEALALGVRDIGENRVQEIRLKADKLSIPVNIHLIGHVQKNKVHLFLDNFCLIHSVDSLDLAREISKHAEKVGKTQEILLQINVSGEETKFGINPKDTLEMVKNVSELPNIKLTGLMTIAPLTSNCDKIRYVFASLKSISEDISSKSVENVSMKNLSMGMSNDFKIAIEEGATIVRIGTAIFGKR
jgi:pyridoxal phosphate enzyme (YggS family)